MRMVFFGIDFTRSIPLTGGHRMNPSTYPRLRSVGVVLTALLVTACGTSNATTPDGEGGSGEDALVAAAKEEGSVTWYSSIPQEPMDAVAQEFQKRYGITINITRGLTGQLTQRLSAEQDSGRPAADVVNLADPIAFTDMTEKGWLTTFEGDDVPGLSDWPTDYLIDDNRIVTGIQVASVAYNTDLVDKEDLEGWESLLDPEYKNEIILSDPAAVPPWLSLMMFLRDNVDEDFLPRLAAQQPTMVESAVPGAQQLAAGEAKLQFPTTVAVVQPLKDAGAPIDTVYFTPATGVEQYTALIDGGPHPNAAKLLLSFLMSEDGQALINEGTSASVLPDVPGTLPLPEDYTAPRILEANQQKADILEALGD
jgi:iron(III) transport system substrate-binding protein